MPEPNFLSMYTFSTEPPKKSPIIKLSCGIGDTDGFPAFDVDSDTYAVKDDSKWGFLMTGGAEFHMPLTVFQVTPNGLADKGGIRLGDIVLEINEEDASELTLSQAHEKIDASGKKIHFLVKSMEEDPLEEFELGEEKSIVLRVPKPVPPPPGASIEARLRAMQRKLSEIAEIPKILSSTLATVSQTFDKLSLTGMPANPNYNGNEHYQHQQKRKLSYDEDAYDYELSDDDDEEEEEDDDEVPEDANFNAREAYQRLKQHVAKQRKSKDVTPESDYASENNYPLNGVEDEEEMAGDDEDEVKYDDDNKDGDDDDDDDNSDTAVSDDDTCEKFNLKFLLTPLGHNTNETDNTDSEIVESMESNDDDDDENDFLSTTFTWNIRNKPKLQINGNNFTDPVTQHIPQSSVNTENSGSEAAGVSGDISEVGNVDKNKDKETNANTNVNANVKVTQQQQTSLNTVAHNHQSTEESSLKQPKLDTFWPWADREKIIYKQSTCHLVPKKPLGLIGQRIQLLAKRNLLEHLGPNNKTTK